MISDLMKVLICLVYLSTNKSLTGIWATYNVVFLGEIRGWNVNVSVSTSETLVFVIWAWNVKLELNTEGSKWKIALGAGFKKTNVSICLYSER